MSYSLHSLKGAYVVEGDARSLEYGSQRCGETEGASGFRCLGLKVCRVQGLGCFGFRVLRA